MIDLSQVKFGVESHAPTDNPTGDRDLCIMEAVAFAAGERWSDAPSCASPVLAAFLRNWNDSLSDEERDRLLPAAVWVPRLVGSLGNEEVELRRAYLALDWLVRVCTPMWFDLVSSLSSHAEKLRSLPEITDQTLQEASLTTFSATGAADFLAWGTESIIMEPARDITRKAAAAAARDAARLAWPSATMGVWDAAREAIASAAKAAIGNANTLQPTVERLQASALDLLDRMLAVKA